MSLYVALLCALCFLYCSRESGAVSFSLFTYPPESTAHDGDWDYLGDVSFIIPQGANNSTEVDITIQDKSERVYLRDNFRVDYSFRDVDPCEKWDIFDTLTIKFALGPPGSCDDSGSIYFLERTYIYDSSKVQFILQ